MTQPSLTPAETEQFVRTLTRIEPKLYAYIRAMVSNWADAEEVLQETNTVLWRKADQALAAENFLGWACGVARLEVLQFRQKQQRQMPAYSPEFLEAVAAAAPAAEEPFDRRRDALDFCLEKLPPRDRELVAMRYLAETADGRTPDMPQLSERVGRPVTGLYKALARIRKALFECIERRLASEEHAPAVPPTEDRR